MKKIKLGLSLLVAGSAMLACNFSSSLGTPTTAPTFAEPTQPLATAMATAASTAAIAATAPATGAPEATGAPQSTAVATSLIPCQVVPQDEASALVGVTFEAPRGGTFPDGSQECLYAAPSGVLTIEVFKAPDAAAAKTERDSFMAGLSGYQENAIGTKVESTPVPDFADGALEAEMHFNNAGGSLDGSAFAFVKGTTMMGIMDIAQDSSAPSLDALKAEATKAMARLP